MGGLERLQKVLLRAAEAGPFEALPEDGAAAGGPRRRRRIQDPARPFAQHSGQAAARHGPDGAVRDSMEEAVDVRAADGVFGG